MNISIVKAIHDGILIRPDACELCDRKAKKIVAHHWHGYDDDHILDVQWLCSSCHSKVHGTPKALETKRSRGFKHSPPSFYGFSQSEMSRKGWETKRARGYVPDSEIYIRVAIGVKRTLWPKTTCRTCGLETYPGPMGGHRNATGHDC